MTIQLRLDTTALAALFPEGSEARLDLQRAVVNQFITQYIKPTMIRDDVMRMVTAARSEAVAQVTKELGGQNLWNTGLSDTFKQRIKDEVTMMASAFTVKTINEAVEHSVQSRMVGIDRTVDIAVNKLSDVMIRERLAERLKGIIP